MMKNNLCITFSYIVVTLLAFAFNGFLNAETVSSPVVGFVALDIQPDSDTVVTIGFHQAAEFSGKLSAAASISDGTATLNLQAVSGIGAANQFAGSYYIRVRTGNESGRVLPILSNTTSSVTVDLEGAAELQIAIEDQISIIPWWTLETLFPSAEQPAEQQSAGNLPPERKLEMLLYTGGDGTSLSPSRIFFLTASGWKESKREFPSAGGVIIRPFAVMLMRSKSSGVTWKLLSSGRVNENDSAILLQTSINGSQDNVIGIDRPVAAKLNELGLESAFEESASNDPADRKDELLILDNSESTKNRPPSATYFRTGGQWVLDGAGFPES
ncbi:MAG: TIGR02597 family protein, partial [Candidatus Marinimicrobia bacterium]|nr:TIGR02597 family protein [Candidatus Neomarinimicrobiota bacterium]